MGDYTADFVGALGLSHIDVLGFSIGGYIAQALTLRHPALVKRLMLVGTGPRAGEPPTDPKYSQYGTSTDPGTGETGLEAFLYLFFPRRRAARPPAGPSGNDATLGRTSTRPAPRKR